MRNARALALLGTGVSTWASRVRSLSLPLLPTRRYVQARVSAARVRALVLTIELCAHQGEASAAAALAVAPVAAVAAGAGEGAAAAAPQVRANVFLPRYRRVTWAAQQALLHVAGDCGIAQLAAPLPAVRQRACFWGSISADGCGPQDDAMAVAAPAPAPLAAVPAPGRAVAAGHPARKRARSADVAGSNRRANHGEAAASAAASAGGGAAAAGPPQVAAPRRSCASRAPGGRSTRLLPGADSGVASVDMCFKYSVLVVCALRWRLHRAVGQASALCQKAPG